MAIITLHQPKGGWGEPSMSPFCMKLECWLRMAKLPFEIRDADMRRAPKGKIPYVDLDGTLMGDSQLIIEHLSKKHGVTLDDHLTSAQRAEAHVVRRMIEEASYFVSLYARWGDDAGWAHTRPAFERILPKPFGLLLPFIRRSTWKRLRAQGTGLHTAGEIYAMGIADYTAVSTLLGERPYFFGDGPSSLDATLYGFVESSLIHPSPSPLKRHVESLPNLVAHRDRVREAHFPKDRFTARS